MRFDGAIAGMGTSSGVRLVVGAWARSPYGAFTDVMVEHAGGHRVLLAPTQPVAEFVSAAYQFDEVRVGPTATRRHGPRWDVSAGPLELTFAVGTRTSLGMLLCVIPSAVTKARWFATAVDPIAQAALTGVHTRGTTKSGRREWYSAYDIHRIDSLQASWSGDDLGDLSRVEPPVRFGFALTPANPSITHLTAAIDGRGASTTEVG